VSNPAQIDTDILVVGYGPVGAAFAALLGGYGASALVIDKASEIFMAPRAIALDNEALRILQSAGLADDSFAKTAIPVVKMRCPYVGEFAQVNTSGLIDGHPKLVTFYQPELEQALRDVVARHPGITVRLGVQLVDFTEDAAGISATVRWEDGRTGHVRCRFLVGADGAHSLVRRKIGQDFKGKTFAEDWLIVDAKDVGDQFDHVEFICDHRRPTPHLVAPGGRTRWEFMLRPGETLETMEQTGALAALLKPWHMGSDVKIERKAVYRFQARACNAFSKGRVFLIGDAAHVTPPLYRARARGRVA